MINRVFQVYWRMTRALTLGVQGVVIDGENRVLLVRHGYRPGWHFPGGGVEFNETVELSLRRELMEETGVKPVAEPQLHGVFANFAAFPGDHIALFIVRDWHRDHVPAPNKEIAEQGFFHIDALPDGTVVGARRRMDEIFRGATINPNWAA